MAKRDHATRTRIRIIETCNKTNLIAIRKIKPWAERDPCNNINPVIIF
jgi:hypothetical protein